MRFRHDTELEPCSHCTFLKRKGECCGKVTCECRNHYILDRTYRISEEITANYYRNMTARRITR